MGARRTLRALSLGTYYGKKREEPAPDADQIRKLAWHVKAKWPVGKVRIAYPGHEPIVVASQRDACRLVTQICAASWPDICAYLNLPADGSLYLVPIPSSEVTRSTITKARWGAARLAATMHKENLGHLNPCIVNSAPTTASHESEDRLSAQALANNYDVRSIPDGPVLYIDDVLTKCEHIAAVDDRLGRPKSAGVLTIGATDWEPRDTCLEWRRKLISYSDLDWVRTADDDGDESADDDNAYDLYRDK